MDGASEDRSPGPETGSGPYDQAYGSDHYTENFNYNSSGHMRVSLDDSAVDTYRDAPESYPSLKRVNSYTNVSRKSLDDMYFGDPRMQRLQQAESNIRREMFKDCTFRPQIKRLPVAYGPLKETGTPFVARMDKWKKEKEHEIKMKKDLTIRSVDEQCSFKPKINKYSDKAVKEIRGGSPEPTHERLYKSSAVQMEQRAKLLEEELMREQQSRDSQCTFQPQLITKNNPVFQQVQPKFNRETPSKAETIQRVAAHLNKDCTFTPQVNTVKSNMSSTKLYLQTNVVDRLSRPVVAADGTPALKATDDSMLRTFDTSFMDGDQNNVMDAATFIGSLQANASAAKPMQSPHPTGANTSSIAQPTKPPLSKEEALARQKKFADFYERQQNSVKSKQKSIENVQQHIAPSFTPTVTKAARRLSRSEHFLTRVNQDVQRRLSIEQRQEVEALNQHSFKPEINKKAEALRGRTAFEMSRGDSLRKEANNRLLKLKADQEQLAEVTLQPAISAKAKELNKSYMKMMKDDNSEQYLDWLKTKEKKLEDKRELERKRRDEMEMAGCTFAPKTTECPAYIKRIKNSMDLVKAARSADSVLNSQVSKPDWR